jgi:hypothetical protein
MDAPKRPSFWPLALIALLAVPLLFVLADGPAIYAVERGWMDWPTFETVWGPLPEVFGDDLVDAYENWWWEKAAFRGGSVLSR